MNIDFRSLIKVTLLPILLLAATFYYIPVFTKPLPDVARLSLPYLPFILLLIGLSLSWVFHHCREFNLFLLFIVIYIALDKLIWHPIIKVDQQLAYLLIVALIPFNFLYHFFSRERGIYSQFGLRRVIFLAAQLFLIYWLLTNPIVEVTSYLNFSFVKLDILKYTAISQPLALIIIVSAIVFIFRLMRKTEVLISGFMTSFIAIIAAVQFYQYPQVATLFIVLAELLVIISITFNAYFLAYLDELTNLPSRRALAQNMSTLGKRYTIAMVDVDHFKKFNDKYGHDVGDQVLKKLANSLRLVRGGKAFRYGGEEFTILFPGKNIDEARLISETLCKNVEDDPFLLRDKKRPKNNDAKRNRDKSGKDKSLTITISIGLAERSEAHAKANHVIKQADKALYKAKNNGRNQVSATA